MLLLLFILFSDTLFSVRTSKFSALRLAVLAFWGFSGSVVLDLFICSWFVAENAVVPAC